MAGGQRMADREGGAHGKRKEQRHGQVEPYGGPDARQADQDREQELPIVVIVQITLSIVGVRGREIGAAQDRVEVGNVHQLFAAVPGLPQVRVENADADKDQERDSKQDLAHQDQAPSLLQPGSHLCLVAPQQQGGEQGQDTYRRIGERQAVLEQPQTGGQPDQVADDQQRDHARQHDSAIPQPAKQHKCHRPGQPAQGRDQQPPQEYSQGRRSRG